MNKGYGLTGLRSQVVMCSSGGYCFEGEWPKNPKRAEADGTPLPIMMPPLLTRRWQTRLRASGLS